MKDDALCYGPLSCYRMPCRAITGKKLPRLYLSAPLANGNAIVFDDAQRHYLADVMRRKAGEQILLFNGSDGEWLATITNLSRNALTVECRQQTRAQIKEPDLLLLCTPIKRDHFDYMIQKASELGVARIQPVITQHTIAGRINTDRLQAIARQAAEQCERLTVPVISPAMPLKNALSGLERDRPLFACLESGMSLPLAQAMQAQPQARQAAILTGPEGGFSEQELAIIRQHVTTVPVDLGPRILRADTAAIAAIASWQALCGDWRARLN